MPLLLNKLLPLPFLPVGFTLLLLAFAAWRRRRWPVVAAGLVLLVASLPAVGGALLRVHENAHPALAVAACPEADAVVVLSGSLREGRAGHFPEWGEAADRFHRGVDLVVAGRAPVLVLTGGKLPWFPDRPAEGEALRPVAAAMGLDPAAIRVTGHVGNTRAEAEAVAEMARAEGWTKVVLVTTAWHLPRAVQQFRRAGLDVTPFPCDYRTRASGVVAVDFLPSSDGLAATETALREWYGRAFYALF